MTYVNDVQTVAQTEKASGFFASLVERFARYRVYRTTVNELSTLSNKELADLGLSRSGIRSVAYNVAYGK